MQQFLIESIVLGLMGGLAGFVLAWVSFGPLLSLTPTIPSFRPQAFRIDSQVFLFSIGVSLLASVLFGLTPALRVTRRDLHSWLREAGRGAKGTIRHRVTRDALVVAEIGLAIVLLVGTGLLIKTLYNLRNDRLGFDSSRVLTVQMCCLDATRYPSPKEVGKFFQQVYDRFESVPGAESIAMINFLPQRQFDGAGSVIQIKGAPPPEPGKESIADLRFISPNFFEMMRIPMRTGRALTLQDDVDHPLVAVINESMVRKYFPDQDPIGQQMQMVNLQPLGRWFTIVGVVADSRDRGLGRETRSTFYLSYLQNQIRGGTVMVRTKPGAQGLVGQVKDVVRPLNQDITFLDPKTLEDSMAESLSPERFSATLLTLFALIALTLASVGVYGVVSYAAMQRTHEIGVRLALGAQRRDVLKLVLGHGAKLAAVGVVLGLIGSIMVSRLLNTMLFGVSARDPWTLVVVSVLLSAVALLACYIPARRAMKIDPLEALRYE